MMSEKDWIINIENAAEEVSRLIGKEAVNQVFQKYGASSADDLNPLYYSEVFSEFDFMAHDADD